MAVIADPNHHLYGPMCGLWAILQTVVTDLPDWEADYLTEWGEAWDTDFLNLIEVHGFSIPLATRMAIQRFFVAIDNA